MNHNYKISLNYFLLASQAYNVDIMAYFHTLKKFLICNIKIVSLLKLFIFVYKSALLTFFILEGKA